MNRAAAVARHLNVAESAVMRVEEWANCLFAVVRGIGARFVSKKVVKVPEVKTLHTVKKTSASGLVMWTPGMKFRQDDAVWEVTSAVNTEIRWDEDICDEVAVWEIDAKFVKNL